MSRSRSESSGELNPTDHSAASSKGYLQIVKDLSNIDKGMCFLKDRDGRTPLHCAAIHGNLHVVRELVSCCPDSVKETTLRGETVLHLAVKNNQQCEAVISLLSLLDEMDLTDEIINHVDVDGNTVLHLAAARKQHQVIKFLLKDTKVNVNAVNAASDISTSLCSSESDNNMTVNGDDHQITMPSSEDHHQINITPRNEEQVVVNIGHASPDSIKMIKRSELIKSYEFESYKRDFVLLASMKNGIIVLCSLFVIFCLDAMLNPPSDTALDRYYFNIFICANIVCFVASLATIPLAMVTTSFNSFYWRAVNVTAGMMIGSAVLLYASVFVSVTNIEQVATWTAKIGSIMLILFCCIIYHRKANHKLMMSYS
ncbi:hypothetical protein ACOSQ2_003043 [Xanthoceras sorbifolium]|uniref:PGG domain-containing protein n=1 Tax=Xanthoceras sorbifolium TaxID=99658 RepID=A0ABQ8IIQ2_9ROSI|nr:hypothetical protein JRO89_XS01G0109000 [Xanthoceras sorbifolium]